MIPEDSGAIEEYFCEFLVSVDNSESPESCEANTAILKFYNDIMHLRNPDSGDVLLEVPLRSITTFEINPVHPDLSSKFERELRMF